MSVGRGVAVKVAVDVAVGGCVGVRVAVGATVAVGTAVGIAVGVDVQAASNIKAIKVVRVCFIACGLLLRMETKCRLTTCFTHLRKACCFRLFPASFMRETALIAERSKSHSFPPPPLGNYLEPKSTHR